jgi:hypothetical protein
LARPKENLSKLTINQLETLTGSHYRAIKKVLSEAGIEPVEMDDNSIYYNPIEALPVIFESQGLRSRKYSPMDDPDEVDEAAMEKLLDPAIQNARLARARTKKVQVETEVMLRKLVPAEDVEKVWTDMIMASRAKLRSLPIRIAPSLVGIKDPIFIEQQIEKEINAALNELKEYDPEHYNDDGSEGDAEMDSSSTTHD